MIDALCGHSRFVVDEGTQWDFGPVRRPDINILERIRILLIGEFRLHHDVVLVQRLVHCRDLSLSKCGVQGIVDDLRSDSKPRRGVAVDDHPRFQSFILKIRIRVANLRKRLDPIEHNVRPFLKFLNGIALDRVLELRIASPASDPEFLGRLQEECRTRKLQPGAKTGDHLISCHLTLSDRLQLNIHLSEPSCAIDVAGSASNSGIGFDNIHELPEALICNSKRLVGSRLNISLQ